MRKCIKNWAIALCAAALAGCSDFLDTVPDNRIDVNGETQLAPLLVSAYPETSPAVIAEYSSDNMMDNGAQFDALLLLEELYMWKDPTGVDNDSPYNLWESCYKAISAANKALSSIEEMGNPKSLDPQRGEALICRAYSHFVLANIFCMAYNPQTAENNLGIPYATRNEEVVFVHYERGTLAETYRLIEADIEAALPLIADKVYKVPKYHFNRKAAYAFAARFYLYYQKWDKVIECADVVLGSNPEVSLRQWEDDFASISLIADIANQYISDDKAANLFIATAYSQIGYFTGPYDVYKRYGHGRDIYNNETLAVHGPWSGRGGLVMSQIIVNNQQKNCFPKLMTYFEYIDKANGIGYAHSVTVPFTTDETLLCRAEAYVLGKHDYPKALADINMWIRCHSAISKDQGADLTLEGVNAYYDELPYAPAVVENANQRSVKKQLNPEGFTVGAGQEENLIQLILHLRRLEGLQEGLRWYDLKRYGIEFSHNRAATTPLVLRKDDPRRAIQLPQDVINAGMKPNPRS